MFYCFDLLAPAPLGPRALHSAPAPYSDGRSPPLAPAPSGNPVPSYGPCAGASLGLVCLRGRPRRTKLPALVVAIAFRASFAGMTESEIPEEQLDAQIAEFEKQKATLVKRAKLSAVQAEVEARRPLRRRLTPYPGSAFPPGP